MTSKTTLILACSFFLFACGDDDGALDTGPALDTSPTMDAGAARDSGPTPDAASDAMDLEDGGAASDVGMSNDAGEDSGTMFPDSGLPDPAWTELEVTAAGECPDFAACGGDIVGVWDTSGGCFEVDIESAISRCPGATVTERRGRGRGRVIFGADGTAHRVAESQVVAGVFIPAICTAAISCEAIETMIAAVASSATCMSEATGDCNCEARYDFAIDNTSTYATDGNEITAPGKRWEYCVDGETLTYQDTSPSGMREPGTVELTRQ